MRESVWTFSNLLSIARVLLVIPIAKLLAIGDSPSRHLAVGLIAIAVSTDFFDGLIARKLHQVTDVGKIVDPLADKIAVGVVAYILAEQGRLPLWFLLTVLFRDAAIFLGGVYLRRAGGIILQSNATGKWAVTAVAALILFTILDIPGAGWLRNTLLVASTGLLVCSFGLYLRRFWIINRAREGDRADGIS